MRHCSENLKNTGNQCCEVLAQKAVLIMKTFNLYKKTHVHVVGQLPHNIRMRSLSTQRTRMKFESSFCRRLVHTHHFIRRFFRTNQYQLNFPTAQKNQVKQHLFGSTLSTLQKMLLRSLNVREKSTMTSMKKETGGIKHR